MKRKEVCVNCRFWEREEEERDLGTCHRNAPIATADSEWMGLAEITKALNLLTWWYIREHADEALAEKQLADFGITQDGLNPWPASFPQTEPTEWCGEWEARKRKLSRK
jgi:hypothetical protein